MADLPSEEVSSGGALRKIDWNEVAQHKDQNSLWLVIHNKVYDVTKFMEEHPGGEEVLLEQAKRDATEAFEDVGHSPDARELQQNYLIGEIVGEKPTSSSSPPKKPGDGPVPKPPPGICPSNFNVWVVGAVIFGVAAAYFAYRYFNIKYPS